MSVFLFIVGAIVFIASIIMGIATWGFIGIIIGLPAGVVSSSLFFGLASVLDKQDDILAKFQSHDERQRKPPATITCARCEKEYDGGRSNCPHCAFRPGR